MELLASGRDADVYDAGDGRVLRRFRDGRDAGAEAVLMQRLADMGYPVPVVHDHHGSDIVMERVAGPTLAEALLDGRMPLPDGAVLLAGLHRQLAATGLVHLDLHPANVLLREPPSAAAVVIDWTNARPGPAGLDVALTSLVLAQAALRLDDDVDLPDAAFPLLRDFLAGFVRAVGVDPRGHLDEALARRRADPDLSDHETRELESAATLVREVCV